MAARLPVAGLALAFLVFYWWILRREFGERAAWCATLILGTSAGWFALSQVGVTDLPLTATFAAAMLLALPWIAKGDARALPATAALMGLAVLAKGLVPLVLGLPLLMRGRIRDLLRWRVVMPFLVIAVPWYVLCYLRNGRTFLDVFFWQHHFGRFTSNALQHAQPWWFYLPVLLAGLLPWSPLLGLAPRGWRDPRRAFLLVWLIFGLVFFSTAANKLPGYLLPLLPAATALMGIGFAEATAAGALIAACALLLIGYIYAAGVLPLAVALGLSRSYGFVAVRPWVLLLAIGIGATVWFLSRRRRRAEATAIIASLAAASLVYLKATVLPEVGRLASARGLWQQIAARRGDACIASLERNWRYCLNYYSEIPLPDCAREPKPLTVVQNKGESPTLSQAPSVDPSSPRVVPSPLNR